MKCLQFLLANYNSADHIEILTKSLRMYHPGFSYEILCCDQGSTDGSDDYLASLPEVHLWRLDERSKDSVYNERQQNVVDSYYLEDYLGNYFTHKVLERDARRTHAAALDFLVSKVAAPIIATLDTDIEFLGPHWIEPFILPFLLDSTVGAVGFQEASVSFQIGTFFGTTAPRLHPCLALWKTAYVWETERSWTTSDEFDLRFPIIRKSLEEKQEIRLVLGDVGYAISNALKAHNYKVIKLPAEDFFRSCRHFYGTTVKNECFDHEWNEWIASLEGEHLKPLVQFAELSQQYVEFSCDAMTYCKSYWSTKNPSLPRQPEVPLVFID